MQAMNGSAGSFRKRGRLIGCCMALALALSALLFAAPAGAANPPTTYLALGDSITFGYTQEKFEEHFPTSESPLFFEENFATYLTAKLKMASTKFATNLKGLHLINNGCPGETTDSMIGNGPLGTAVDPTGQSPCGYQKSGLELHHPYPGVSQMENALKVIAQNSASPGSVKNVTIGIGANDELASISKCKTEVKEEGEKYLKAEAAEFSKWDPNEFKHPANEAEIAESIRQAVHACISGESTGVFNHIAANVHTMISVLRNGSSFGGVNYGGKIEILGVYNPETFVVIGSDLLQSLLNGKLQEVAAEFPGVVEGDIFSVVNPQKGGEGNTKEKEAICKYTEFCNKKDQEANATKEGAKAFKEKEEEGKLIVYPPTCTTGGPECIGDIHPTEANSHKTAEKLFKIYTP
jgi:lysophospholipase L1-like esterase